MPALKCPNPSCPFLFDPTLVPAGAVLTCPRCSMRFTLGPSPTVPQQRPTQPAVAHPPAATTDVEPDTHSPPTRRRRSEGFPILITIGGVLLLFGLIAGALYVAILAKRGSTHLDGGSASSEVVVDDKNFAYKFPGSPWVQDQETRNALNIHAFALKRTESPEAWAALEVRNFGSQTPTESELRDSMSDQLRRAFLNLPDELPLEPAKWAGLDARKCQFRAERKGTGTICSGECYFVAQKGFGFWFYTWCAERDAGELAAQFDDLRARFRVLGGVKDGGIKAPAPETDFHGTSVNYKVSGTSSIWKKPEGLSPTDEDPKADLLLRGELTGRQKRDFIPRATLVVIVLKDDGEPDEVGTKYVRKRHTLDPEVFGMTKITELSGEPEGDDAPVPVANTTPTKRLKVSPGGENASRSAEKLVVYSAIKVGENVVIAEGSCPWSERSAWERRLMQIVGSLRE